MVLNRVLDGLGCKPTNAKRAAAGKSAADTAPRGIHDWVAGAVRGTRC